MWRRRRLARHSTMKEMGLPCHLDVSMHQGGGGSHFKVAAELVGDHAYCWGKDGRDEPAEQSRKPIKSNLCMTYYSPISNLSILNRRAQHDEMADAALGI